MAIRESEFPGESILRQGRIISSSPGLDVVELPSKRHTASSSLDFDGVVFDSADPNLYLRTTEPQARQIWVHSFPSWSLKPPAKIIDFSLRPAVVEERSEDVQTIDLQTDTQAA